MKIEFWNIQYLIYFRYNENLYLIKILNLDKFDFSQISNAFNFSNIILFYYNS